MTLPAVLLHGFAGTGRAWDGVRTALGPDGPELVTPDLPGHGVRAADRPVSFAGCVDTVLSDAPDAFVLCGYSLGGRVALHVALAAPQRIRGLVLVSTTAGIDSATDREARRVADETLAAVTEISSIDDFADRWRAQPLFADDPDETARAWHEDMHRNDPAGLAAVLRGIGTGAMVPLWDRLGEIAQHAQVLVGERDTKFTAIGERLVAGLPDATLTVVPGAGHALPREAPAAVAGALCTAATR